MTVPEYLDESICVCTVDLDKAERGSLTEERGGKL